MPRISRALLPVVIFASLLVTHSAHPQLPAPRSRIVQAVDDTRLTTLTGNVHPLARSEFDQGALADATPLRRIVLLLERSPEQELALQRVIDQQQDKTTTAYHQWLTPQAFASAFGPSDRDLSIVTAWLSAQGFTGIQVSAAHTFIEFNGTAATVRSAFRTSMHRYAVNGQQHFANATDPAIPAALAPVVAGIASLNNFPRRAASHRVLNTHPGSARAEPSFTFTDNGQVAYGVTPTDFATIYNVLPLWSAATPIDGTGQTIAIAGQTDINPADFVNFRKLFNLPIGNTATPTGTQYLNIIYNGPNPGVTGDEGEADIDTQWSGAVAKSATIDYVVSEGTEVTQGTDLSALYIVDNNLAPILSYSYGQCEQFLGTSGNAFYKNLWQQAAAQGITVLIAAGDSGAAGCDIAGVQGASNGLAVNGLASTPYNIAVGGTDFYMPNGGTAYWNSTNSATTQASAKGYIPEIPWNQSCANSVFQVSPAFTGQSAEQICNSSMTTTYGLLSVVGGGGGASACTQSSGSASSCKAGYPKPSWQAGIGVPSDGVRDLPDVSLFASSGFFGAFYIVCQQSINADGKPCNLAAPTYDFAGYGGTSVAAPAFAGVVALVNQKTGSRQGNANYVLYNLAAQQSKASTACSSIGGAPAAGCVFNDITTSTIAMPCLKGTPNCTITRSGDAFGVLPGYSSSTGYDLASGLGSVNAANLVNNWSSASFIASSTTLALSSSSITHGSQVSATVNVTATGGTPTGNVSINALAANGSIQAGTLQAGVYAASLSDFPGGAYSVQAHYAGDGTYAPSDSNSVALTVSPESSTTTLRALLYNPSNGTTSALANGATYPYGGYFLLRADVAGLSGQGVATGNVLLTDSGSPLDGGTFRLNSTSNTEDQTRSLVPGSHLIAAAYEGDASFNASSSQAVAINITRAQTAAVVQADELVLSAANTLTLTAQISALGFGSTTIRGYGAAAPSGMVTFSTGSTALGSANLTQALFPNVPGDVSSVSFVLPASALAIGSSPVTVTYSGDSNYAGSVSAPIQIIVTGATQAATTTTLSLSAATVAQGATFVFTANVSGGKAQSPAQPPTGTITFMSDGQPAGPPITLVSGVGILASSLLNIAPGTHQITALYSGDINYQASVSAASTFTVTPVNTASSASIFISPSTAVQGATVTVAATISPATPIPTGTAQLILDGNLYGSPVVLTGSTTTLSLLTATLQAGTHLIAVLYSGDSSHKANTSASATLTLLTSAGSFTFTPATASATAVLGQTSTPVTLTATPNGGFQSTIRFACAGGLPSGAVCLFTPSSILPTGSTPQTTVLTISPVASIQASNRIQQVFAVTFSGLFLLFVPRRNRRLSLLAILLAVSTLGVLSGCGSGGVDPNTTNAGGLSAGSYSVTVTATGGSTIQTAIVNLTIQ